MTVSLRDAEAGDISVLEDLYRRSSLSNEGDRDNLLANPSVLVVNQRALDEGRIRVAVGEGGRVVGFVTILERRAMIELEDLFVDPDWMRQGIGRALIDDVVVNATGSGIGRIEVVGNPHALQFYEKVGFVFDHHEDTQFGRGFRMHLELAV